MASPNAEAVEEPEFAENTASKLTASSGVWGSIKQTIFGMGSHRLSPEASSDSDSSDGKDQGTALAQGRPASLAGRAICNLEGYSSASQYGPQAACSSSYQQSLSCTVKLLTHTGLRLCR